MIVPENAVDGFDEDVCFGKHDGLLSYIQDCDAESLSVHVFISLALVILGSSLLVGWLVVKIRDGQTRRQALDLDEDEVHVEGYHDEPQRTPDARETGYADEKEPVILM